MLTIRSASRAAASSSARSILQLTRCVGRRSISRVSFLVKDVDAALRFYGEGLGLKTTPRAGSSGAALVGPVGACQIEILDGGLGEDEQHEEEADDVAQPLVSLAISSLPTVAGKIKRKGGRVVAGSADVGQLLFSDPDGVTGRAVHAFKRRSVGHIALVVSSLRSSVEFFDQVCSMTPATKEELESAEADDWLIPASVKAALQPSLGIDSAVLLLKNRQDPNGAPLLLLEHSNKSVPLSQVLRAYSPPTSSTNGQEQEPPLFPAAAAASSSSSSMATTFVFKLASKEAVKQAMKKAEEAFPAACACDIGDDKSPSFVCASLDGVGLLLKC